MQLTSLSLALTRAGFLSFSPASLFAAGESGVWYDPSDMSTMFQDAAGTTPVTSVEQPVGLILDKSGRGNHATQTTVTSRPVLSARYNLLTKTEQFDDAVWTPTRASISANVTSTTDPLGGNTADKLVETATIGDHFIRQTSAQTVVSGVSYTFSCAAKAAGRTTFAVYISGVTATGVTSFNLSSGTVTSTSANATSAIEGLGDGWYRCSVTVTTNSTSSLIYIYPNVGGVSYTGDGTSGIYIWGASLVPADQASLPYQRVNTATDYDTDPSKFKPYLRFDGVDDWLVTPTITPGIDKAQVFAGVRKLSDAAAGTIAELSADLNAINGSFYLVSADSLGRLWASLSRGTATSSVDQSAFNTTAAPDTAVIAATHDIAGDLSTIRRNGIAGTSGTGDKGTGNFGNYPIYIGRRAGTAFPFNGHLYGLIVRFGANLPTGTIASTETWLNQRTGAY